MNPPSEWHYVAAAYLIVFVAVLVWVAIIGAKLSRMQRQLGDLVEQARTRENLEVVPK
jgi:CcmD family protein